MRNELAVGHRYKARKTDGYLIRWACCGEFDDLQSAVRADVRKGRRSTRCRLYTEWRNGVSDLWSTGLNSVH